MTAAKPNLGSLGLGTDGATTTGGGPANYSEVFDRDYKHDEGRRLGRGHAVWALVRDSMKRAMGIKKKWTAKSIPIVRYLVVVVVALIPTNSRALATRKVKFSSLSTMRTRGRSVFRTERRTWQSLRTLR